MAVYQGKERKEGEMPQLYLSVQSTPTERVVVVGRIPGPRIKRVRNWELLRRMEFRHNMAGGDKGEMNGLANWPHFYFNVAEVGIIIGGNDGATLLPLIDVLFSTLVRFDAVQ